MTVQLVCCGDDNLFWFKATINGREVGSSVPLQSIEQFGALDDRLTKLVNAVYQRGLDDGRKEARLAMRIAMGF